MRKWGKLTSLGIIGFLSLVALVSGCGQKRPMETLVKNEHEKVNQIKTDKDFIYLISVSDSDSRAEVSRPHWMGSSKIVRFKFTKNALEVRQVVEDARFKQNPTNEKPILSIPVEYKNYRCRQNDFKECTNKEEVDNDTSWDKKEYFIPDYEHLEIQEVSYLPLALDQLNDNCFSQTSQKLIKSELTPESLNIEFERSYQVRNIECAQDIMAGTLEEFLDTLVFNVRYHVSIVEASKLTDPQYQEFIYPVTDHSFFGFFTTEEFKLDIDNRPMASGAVTKLNRWSPNRKEIVYYLNDAFENKENAKIKEQTYKVASAVNQALKEAGTELNFKIQSAPTGVSAEDLRSNMIVLVPEPMDSGLLGYGPTAVNPRTGEIIHGRVVMYLGNMKQTISRTWDEVVLEQIRNKKASQLAQDSNEHQPLRKARESTTAFAGGLSPIQMQGLLGSQDLIRSNSFPVGRLPDEKSKVVVGNRADIIARLRRFLREPQTTQRSQVRVGEERSHYSADINGFMNHHISELDYYSRHNYFPAEYFAFDNAILSAFKGQIPEHLLKSWSQLTETERAQVIDLVLPISWTVTLIHEIGHNLGLRHNFAGSEDKANFYTEEELKAKGIDYSIHISSVMEYPFEDIGALPVMGKYDIAALRYGYTGQVLLADEKTLVDVRTQGIKETRQELEKKFKNLPPTEQTEENWKKFSLKNYEFCTDEHVNANPGCKRFDTGTNLREIADHIINTYNRYYRYRNFRQGRRFFNLSGDLGYLSRIANTFYELRLFFERYNSVKEIMPDDSKWETDPDLDMETRQFLGDLKASVQKIAEHFMAVLVEPDVMCVYRNKENKQLGVIPISWFQSRYANPTAGYYQPGLFNCLRDLRNTDEVEWLGQIGKYINSRKDPASNNPYVDEIDVRGIMIDKILASHFLLTRNLGSILNDSSTGNFLDIPEYREKILKLYIALLLDEVPVRIQSTLIDGSPLDYQGINSFWWTHFIKPSYVSRVNKVLDLQQEVPFVKILLQHLEKNLFDLRDTQSSGKMLRVFQVARNLEAKDVEGKSYEVVEGHDGNKYYIFQENLVALLISMRWKAAKVLQTLEEPLQVVLIEAFESKKSKEEVERMLKEAIEKMEIKDKKQAEEILVKAHKAYEYFLQSGNERFLQLAAQGLLHDSGFYEDLLAALPDSRLPVERAIKH